MHSLPLLESKTANFIFIGVLVLGMGCAPKSGLHKPAGGRAQGRVAYDALKPVFAKSCSGCHPSRSGPDWLDYSQAKNYVNNGRLMQRAVLDKSMPPPGSAEAAAISESDRQMINDWIRSGGAEHKAGSATSSAADGGGSRVSASVQRCFQCHGNDGPGSEAEPKIPRLAGQNEGYLFLQLERFKFRKRIDPTDRMNDAVLGASKTELVEMARYFSSRPRMGAKPPDAKVIAGDPVLRAGRDLARESCDMCHSQLGDRQNSTDWTPVLSGQSKQYLFNQLLYFRNNERASPLMHEISKRLSNADIEALAAYYAL